MSTDGLFACAIFLTSLFILQLGFIGPLLFVALAPLYALLRWRHLLRTALPAAVILLIPALALASVLWSDLQRETLKYALQLSMTAGVGVLLAAARDKSGVLKGIFVAFAIYLAVSLAYGGYVFMGAYGLQAFSGLNAGKNMFADMSASGALVAMALLFWSLGAKQFRWAAAAVVVLGLALFLLVSARSAGALVGAAAGLLTLASLASLRGVGRAARAAALAVLALCMIPLALTYRTLTAALIEFGAEVFDKDPTLTGRTYFWYRAQDVIREAPWLGHGYASFWREGNVQAEGLWMYADVPRGAGFNFHNTFVDLLVELGWTGVAAFAVVLLVSAAALAVRFVRQPSIILCFWVAMWVYQVVRMPLETLGLTPFYFTTMLLYGALAAGLVRVSAQAAAAPAAYRPRPATWKAAQPARVGNRRFSRSAARVPKM